MEGNSSSFARPRVVAAALEQHTAGLTAFVRARVPRDEVQDVLQIAALRAIERSDSLSDPARVRGWLYRLHRNVATDATQARASRERLRDQAASDSEAIEPTGAMQETQCRCSVVQAGRLSESYASILKLIDLGDLTLAEASKTLGISVNNATVRLHRARRALRQRMLTHCATTNLRDCASCRCADDGCCES